MLTKCESGSSHFQPGEGPSRGLLCDCTTSPINRYTALIITLFTGQRLQEELDSVKQLLGRATEQLQSERSAAAEARTRLEVREQELLFLVR